MTYPSVRNKKDCPLSGRSFLLRNCHVCGKIFSEEFERWDFVKTLRKVVLSICIVLLSTLTACACPRVEMRPLIAGVSVDSVDPGFLRVNYVKVIFIGVAIVMAALLVIVGVVNLHRRARKRKENSDDGTQDS